LGIEKNRYKKVKKVKKNFINNVNEKPIRYGFLGSVRTNP